MAKIIMSRCDHCRNKQATIFPWERVPICRKCNKPIVKELSIKTASK